MAPVGRCHPAEQQCNVEVHGFLSILPFEQKSAIRMTDRASVVGGAGPPKPHTPLIERGFYW